MRFEQRLERPEASADWQDAANHFWFGQARQAWQATMENRRAGKRPICVDDWILAIEISRANGRSSEDIALSKLALKEHPNNPFLQIYWSRTFLSRGLVAEGIRFLEEDALDAKTQLPSLWAAELASNYGAATLAASCHASLRECGSPDNDANLLYLHSFAFHSLREWDEAIRFARRTVEVAPRWQRARAFLCHCLLSRGRLDEAEKTFAEAKSLELEDALLDITEAMYAFSLGQFERSESALEGFIDRWPKNDYTSWARRTLFILCQSNGEIERADAFRDAWDDVELPENPAPEGERIFLPLTLIAQSVGQCVPTSVAMVMRAQGHQEANPEQMFNEMGGRQGTALWRMRQWLNERGLRTVAVKLDVETVKALLRSGVPLIGTLQGAFESHVEVLCGFDERLEVFYLRDPMHWTPGMISQAAVLKRYEPEGCLYAVIDPINTQALAAAEAAYSNDGNAMLDLAEAVGRADREGAERAFAHIADGSAASATREQIALKVVLSPRHFSVGCKPVLDAEKLPPVVRFRALMALRSEEHRALVEKFIVEEEEMLGKGCVRYLRLMQKIQDGEWREALAQVERLLQRSTSMGNLWVSKAEILAELGDSEGSNAALDRAIELMPRAVWLRERALRLNASKMTWSVYLAEFDRLIAEDPSEITLLWGRALALYEGPDGRAFEQSAREYLRWFPRDPVGWQLLAQWFSAQGRDDLADALMREGRELLDPEDLPWRFANELDAVALENRAIDEPTKDALPIDRGALFGLLGQRRDPRWHRASERLETMRRDGMLTWVETAKLCAARLLFVAGSGDAATTDMYSIFPQTLPGPAHWFASSVAETVSGYVLHPGTAKAFGEWIDRVVPGAEAFQNLWFQRILLVELEQENERALGLWESFIERYPESASAHYRLGCIRQAQSDFPNAILQYQRALESNPGLPGALESLRDCAQRVNDFELLGDCIERIRLKSPHSFRDMQSGLLYACQYAPASLRTLLEEAEAGFPDAPFAVLKAAVDLAGESPDRARQVLTPLGDGTNLDDTTFEEFLRIEFAVNGQTGDLDRSEKLAVAGLDRWPDSLPLKSKLAAILTEKGNQDCAHLLFGEVLATPGGATGQNAFDFLSTTKVDATVAAKGLLEQQSEERQQEDLAEAFVSAMQPPEFVSSLEEFLLWCHNQYPRNKAIASCLVDNYYYHSQSKKAVQLARELYDAEPEHPYWSVLLGRVMLDHDAQKALPYLDQAYVRDHSGGLLFELGRCHQILGNRAESVRYYWEHVKQDPMASTSLTALQVQGEPAQLLWPYVTPMLEAGLGLHDEYFHVSMVFIARSMGQHLPPVWLDGAVKRVHLLLTYPGFRDERRRLSAAVRAWIYARPEDGGQKQGLLEKLRAGLLWPGTKWVPRG